MTETFKFSTFLNVFNWTLHSGNSGYLLNQNVPLVGYTSPVDSYGAPVQVGLSYFQPDWPANTENI